MKVIVINSCLRELKTFPEEVRGDFLDAVSDLESGINLEMPLSRKMAGMGTGVYELRLKDKDGIFRVIYFIKKTDAIYIIHAFQKKSQKTPLRNVKLALQRIRSIK